MTALILECAVRALVAAVSVGLVLRLLRVRSAGLQRGAWLAVLLASLAMPLLMKLGELVPADVSGLPWLEKLDAAAVLPATSGVRWQAILLYILAAGALALLARQAIALLRWWNVRRTARPIRSSLCLGLDVRASGAVNAPATAFSTILVPNDFEILPAEAQRAVIAHERAHVLNGDFYVQCLAQLHRSLFWFSPLAWWLPKRLSLLSEHISDEAAIAELQERTAYAEVLLSFAARALRDDPLVAMAGTTTLAVRIEKILADDGSPRDGRIKVSFLTVALLAVIATVAGLQSMRAQPASLRPALNERLGSSGSANNAALTTPSGDVVLPKSNPRSPLSQPFYPPASRRLGEHGTVVLKLHVLEDGSVGDAIIDQSSGYPDLDYAAMYESFRWRLDPGTVDGTPLRMWGRVAVTFKIEQ